MQANFADSTEQDVFSRSNHVELIDGGLPTKVPDWAHLKRAMENDMSEEDDHVPAILDGPVEPHTEALEDTESSDKLRNVDWGALSRAINETEFEDQATQVPSISLQMPEDGQIIASDASPAISGEQAMLQQNITQMRETLECLRAEVTAVRHEFESVCRETSRIRHITEGLDNRSNAQEKVFDTLHDELQSYKNDFVYERFKPTVRSLLFLCDSLEQFDSEVEQRARPQVDPQRRGVSPHLVRENLAYFRNQLVEALKTCEVTPMETPTGTYIPEQHKVFEVVPVEEDNHNTVQQVLRNGWYLNGRILRPAEVIIGRYEQHATTEENSAH